MSSTWVPRRPGGRDDLLQGTVEGLRTSGTRTGKHLDDRARLKPPADVRQPRGALEIRGASSTTFGTLTSTSRSAPWSSSPAWRARAEPLIDGSVARRDGVVTVDQTSIRGSRRSNPATYTGLLDPIRTAFAKANGVKPALFSANSEGACPNCNGVGVIYTDLAIMTSVATACEECEGKRFDASVLEYHLGGRDISEVLAMSVDEAREFFGTGEARTRPRTRSWTGSPTSGSATSASASRSRPCPAASVSA